MRQRLRAIIQKSSFVGAAFLLINFIPISAFADGSTTDPSSDPSSSSSTTTTTPSDDSGSSSDTSTTPSTSGSSSSTPSTPAASTSSTDKSKSTGPNTPTGAAASTYTYDAATGLWSNQYYTWNPTTGQTTPITPQTYSYNPSTGMWDTTQWAFDAATDSYQPNVVTVTTPPAGAATANTPSSSSDVTPDTSSNSSGSDSTNPSTSTTNTSNGIFDNFYNASISNNISGNAQSGDSLVVGNTTGGDAASGNALDLDNVINMVQSSSGLGNVATFEDNITGNVDGNLLLDPGTLESATDPTTVNNIAVNNDSTGEINNDVDLTAGSGNATVANNTTGGSATSGNADAVANVVNMINSIISANQSFLGVINIYGNLDGNILVPSDLLNSLLATNGSSSTTPTDATTTVDNTNDQAINNDVSTAASTGQASVTGNTSAGSATSGNASTNVTIFNLTGAQIVASNSLLVFVNVLGTWVGFIMNAPAGTTAAALGGGVTTDTTGGTSNTAVNNSTNDAINNDIQLGATSGDANVSNNTTAGDATSGDATSSANLLNLENSDFSLSNWFGVLFINVFGNWIGSLEATSDTAAASNTPTSTTAVAANTGIKGVGVFSFVPTGSSDTYNVAPVSSGSTGSSTGSTTSKNKTQTTLVSYIAKPGTIIHDDAPASSFHLNVLPFVGGVLGIGVLGIEQFRSVSRRRFNRAVSVVMLSRISND
jgi:hypothetical protein